MVPTLPTTKSAISTSSTNTHLSGAGVDPEDAVGVAADDTVTDASVGGSVGVGGGHGYQRSGADLVLAQADLVLSRVEGRPVVVDVADLHLHHGCGAETTCAREG